MNKTILFLESVEYNLAIEGLISYLNLNVDSYDLLVNEIGTFIKKDISLEQLLEKLSTKLELSDNEQKKAANYIENKIIPLLNTDTTHTELTIPPEQEPMVIPGEVVHNTPKEEVVVKEKLAPKEVEQKMEIEPEKEIDRSILLEEIENPTPAHQVIKKDQPTLKKPGIPLYEQKLQQSVRSAPQTQTINDPYKESIE